MIKKENIILSQINILEKKFKPFKDNKKKINLNDLLLVIKIKLVEDKLKNKNLTKWLFYKILFIENSFLKKNFNFVFKFFLKFSNKNLMLSDEFSEIFYDYSTTQEKKIFKNIFKK